MPGGSWRWRDYNTAVKTIELNVRVYSIHGRNADERIQKVRYSFCGFLGRLRKHKNEWTRATIYVIHSWFVRVYICIATLLRSRLSFSIVLRERARIYIQRNPRRRRRWRRVALTLIFSLAFSSFRTTPSASFHVNLPRYILFHRFTQLYTC